MGIFIFFTQPNSGRFGYKSWTTFASQGLPRGAEFAGAFYDATGAVFAGHTVTLATDNIPKTNINFYYRGFGTNESNWGKNVTITLKEFAFSSKATGTLLFPQQVVVDYSFNPSQSYASVLNISDKLNVAKDPNSTKGLLVVAEYSPSNNDSLKALGYTEPLRNGFVTNDNGTITMTAELFKNFPKGCYYNLTIARVNYMMIKNSEGQAYAISASSFVENTFRYLR